MTIGSGVRAAAVKTWLVVEERLSPMSPRPAKPGRSRSADTRAAGEYLGCVGKAANGSNSPGVHWTITGADAIFAPPLP